MTIDQMQVALERYALTALEVENQLQAAGDHQGAQERAAWRQGVRDAAEYLHRLNNEGRVSQAEIIRLNLYAP